MTEEFRLTPPDEIQPAILEADLVSVWDKYPRRVKRTKALLEIQKAIERLVAGETGPRMKKSEAVGELVKAVTLFASSPAGNRGEFTPHPTSWFHQSRYLDDPNDWFLETAEERLKSLNQVGVYNP